MASLMSIIRTLNPSFFAELLKILYSPVEIIEVPELNFSLVLPFLSARSLPCPSLTEYNKLVRLLMVEVDNSSNITGTPKFELTIFSIPTLVAFQLQNKVLSPLLGLPATDAANIAAVVLPLDDCPVNEYIIPVNSISFSKNKYLVTNELTPKMVISSNTTLPFTCC